MKYDSWNLSELIAKSETKDILLPNFQRDFVWDRKKNQQELLTSVLYDIPIGSLLILQGDSNYFATKELCLRQQSSKNSKEMCMYLLDGQQRLSTLKSIFWDYFREPKKWKNNYNNLYPQLRTRWFLRIIPKTDEIDLFGWETLKFDGAHKFNQYEPSEISNFLEYEIIYPNQTDKWFHPEYNLNSWYNKDGSIKESARNTIIAKEAAEQGFVPLYSIFESINTSFTTTLHYKVINKIAQNKIDVLKAQVDDGNIELEDLFDYIDDGDIDQAWNDLANNWVNSITELISSIMHKKIPIILLSRDEMGRAIHTFEYVNKGGTALSTYDLIVAKAAQDRELESLTDRIKKIVNRKIKLPSSLTGGFPSTNNKWNPNTMDTLKEGNLTSVVKNQYLNLLSIFSHCKYIIDVELIKVDHIKKEKQLNLTHNEINQNTEITVISLLRACAFLQYRCGNIKIDDLNYELMILPIAYVLRDDSYWNSKLILDKLEYWYWSSLFGGAYRERPNQQCIEDIKKLVKWFKLGTNEFIERKNKVLKVEGYSDMNTLLLKNEDKNIPLSIRRGILQYIISKAPKDFLSEEIYLAAWDIAAKKEYTVNHSIKELKVDDHHICPLSSATKIGESSKKIRKNPEHILNSPLNRTYISSTANSIISDKNPQDYFKYVSNISSFGHCIPHINKYNRSPNENDEQYYQRVLTERYNEIYRDLIIELQNLQN